MVLKEKKKIIILFTSICIFQYVIFSYFNDANIGGPIRKSKPGANLQSRQLGIGPWKFRPRMTCNCDLQPGLRETTFESKLTNFSHPLLKNSTCSPEATEVGENQKVVSYSFYDGKVSHELQAQWRFLVLGDPTVERFLIRDLDSRISAREWYAVREWEDSGRTFHGMRDHPAHGTAMMAGLWGGNNRLLGDAGQGMQRDLAMNRQDRCCGIDQAALEIYVYSFNNSKSILIHDSYLCGRYHDSVPFPTQRTNLLEYVGQPIEYPINYTSTEIVHKCPEECRPTVGKGWEHC